MSFVGKRRDGFDGEKLISIPDNVWKDAVKRDPDLFRLYISHIGYFPKAYNHYRDRRKGCEDTIIFYCIHGKGYCLLDGKQFTVTANQYLIIPATDKSIRYWADEQDPWTIYWLHITGRDIQFINQSLNFSLTTGPVKTPFNDKAIAVWKSIYENLEMGYSRENMLNACFSIQYFLITLLYPEKHSPALQIEAKDMVTDSIKLMQLNLEKKLSVQEMAQHIGHSASHFSSLFRKATGVSPLEYFIQLKMQKACQLLNARDAKIKAVSYTLGYDDPYYFSRLFKRVMGSSPEQYRSGMKQQP